MERTITTNVYYLLESVATNRSRGVFDLLLKNKLLLQLEILCKAQVARSIMLVLSQYCIEQTVYGLVIAFTATNLDTRY